MHWCCSSTSAEKDTDLRDGPLVADNRLKNETHNPDIAGSP